MGDFLRAHLGKLLGTAYGIVLSVVYLGFGFVRMLVVALLIALGYWIGARFDRKERLWDLLHRILPESFFDRDHR